jgi:hypothetical protein
LNPGRRGGKPATNRLSYGAAFLMYYSVLIQRIFLAARAESAAVMKLFLVSMLRAQQVGQFKH